MLEKLMALIRAGGTFQTGSLAAQLGTSPEMVEAMLAHLQRAGLVHPYEKCGEGCEGCSLQKTCSSAGGGARLWQVDSGGG
jgi:Mn-dependent DtxR family transcriptional regulator